MNDPITNADEEYIQRWRASTIDPNNVDQEELDLRRRWAAMETRHDDHPNDKKLATVGFVIRSMGAAGSELGKVEAILRREMLKAVHENDLQIERLRNYLTYLERRVAELERKSKRASTAKRRPPIASSMSE